MLEDLNKNCVDMKLNYSGEQYEPVVLPSRFPFLLCGNNSGIAVGMSSDLVSHNFTEVAEGIKYYIDNKDCSISDLMQFIKGPDFPTAGKIINGEDLLNIYSTGRGTVKVAAHYDISKKGNKTLITFHDIPYGVEIDSGVKAPLKKLVLEDGYEVFEDINVEKAGPRNFDIKITLSKDANVAKCLEILFNKTRLCDSVKINNTIIINGEPKLLNLKEMIAYWVNYRSNIIKKISINDYNKTNHKLTVVLGLQKGMSNIDKLIEIIRSSTNNSAAKVALMKEFELTEEQATAVLEIKLGRLSKLDIMELNDDREQLEATLAKLNRVINDEQVRYDMIKKDLDDIKKTIGNDDRLTEIYYSNPSTTADINKPQVKEEYKIYAEGLKDIVGVSVDNSLIDIVYAYNVNDIIGYTSSGLMRPIRELGESIIGATVNNKQSKFIAVTSNGNIKVSLSTDYKFTKVNEKIMKLKEDDSIIYAGFCDDNDYIVLLGENDKILKLSIKDLPVASKLTIGVKSGFNKVLSAAIAQDSDNLLFVTKENKAKFTSVKDFSTDNRGNKGQSVTDNTVFMKLFNQNRENIYVIPKQGKILNIPRNKISIKSRTAIGASLANKEISKII